MMRLIGKTCLACAYSWSGALRFLYRRPDGGMPFIVGYHRVVDDFPGSVRGGSIPSMLISTRMLERHIDWLASRFSIMSLDEITARLQSGEPFEKPAAAITFDDGYSDVYHHAYPLLRRKGVPAGFFVVTGLIGTGRPQVFDRLYSLLHLLQQRGLPVASTVGWAFESVSGSGRELEKLPSAGDEPFRLMTLVLNTFPQEQVEKAMVRLEDKFPVEKNLQADTLPMSWEMIEAMHQSGMTIGSHTKSHLLLTSESLETVGTELIESRRALESRLKAPVHHFAYPDGRFNPATVRAVEQAGYRFGYGICNSGDCDRPLLTIPRKVLWERSCVNAFGTFSSAIMKCQSHWAFDPVNRCDHDHSTVPEEARRSRHARAVSQEGLCA
jgi:peptidoglycan/xylan/chitin deacetylase (PgdA/CDA1 family)